MSYIEDNIDTGILEEPEKKMTQTFEEIRKYAEKLEKSQANYMFGYLKGFHNIKEDVRSVQRIKEAIEKAKSRSDNRWTDIQIEEFVLKELEIE